MKRLWLKIPRKIRVFINIIAIILLISAAYILLDCPPALGYLTINALAAANSIVIPLQCEFFALEGVQQLRDTISVVQEK